MHDWCPLYGWVGAGSFLRAIHLSFKGKKKLQQKTNKNARYHLFMFQPPSIVIRYDSELKELQISGKEVSSRKGMSGFANLISDKKMNGWPVLA